MSNLPELPLRASFFCLRGAGGEREALKPSTRLSSCKATNLRELSAGGGGAEAEPHPHPGAVRGGAVPPALRRVATPRLRCEPRGAASAAAASGPLGKASNRTAPFAAVTTAYGGKPSDYFKIKRAPRTIK